jgi:hypothetical protein
MGLEQPLRAGQEQMAAGCDIDLSRDAFLFSTSSDASVLRRTRMAASPTLKVRSLHLPALRLGLSHV